MCNGEEHKRHAYGSRDLDPEHGWGDHPHWTDDTEENSLGSDLRDQFELNEDEAGADEGQDRRDEKEDIRGTRVRGRVMRCGKCTIETVFGFDFQSGNAPNLKDEGLVKWDRLRPEFGISIWGRIRARIQVLRLDPEPGTLTVTVSRSGPGPALRDYQRVASGTAAQIHQQWKNHSPIDIEPPSLKPTAPPLTETITAKIVWHPDGFDEPCKPMVENIRVRWFHGRKGKFQVIGPKIVVDRKKTHASTGRTPEPWPPGDEDKMIVPTEVTWVVEDPEGCCKQGSGYAVIQFVRHEWDLKERPKIKGEDDWNLDILDSEVPSQPSEEYDPTFTHNPQGSDPEADPVVYPIPYGEKGNAIVQMDKPGIPQRLYRRFLEHGGKFTWKFHSFLVCLIDGGVAEDYLTNGLVEQEIVWQVEWKFEGERDSKTGQWKPPRVTAEKRGGYPKKYGKCKPLEKVLEKYKLRYAYDNPCEHRIAIPAAHP